MVLLFDRERSEAHDEPPAHGAFGSIHTAFLAAAGEYEAWKERLADREQRERYWVVSKVGEAGAVAEKLDPRST